MDTYTYMRTHIHTYTHLDAFRTRKQTNIFRSTHIPEHTYACAHAYVKTALVHTRTHERTHAHTRLHAPHEDLRQRKQRRRKTNELMNQRINKWMNRLTEIHVAAAPIIKIYIQPPTDLFVFLSLCRIIYTFSVYVHVCCCCYCCCTGTSCSSGLHSRMSTRSSQIDVHRCGALRRLTIITTSTYTR
eukprot:GHVU01189936.1.p1 GENE.GHVU01189936.1~~GHVU01189936.1.p1  ORF type:complete len:187 (-),score=2.45 GHVU01189936.1:167-727(-)